MDVKIIIIFLFLTTSAFAQVHYVRDGATGDGSSWANAFDTLPDTLQRGHTYYIADGNYGSYTFDDAESGSQWITIKKAIIEDHGTDAGWQDSYGDGQAVFGNLAYSGNYYEYDGQSRNELNWRDVSSYGFRVDSTITLNPSVNNIIHRYVDVGGEMGKAWPNVPDKGISMQTYGTPWRSNLVFSHMHIHNIGIAFHSRANNDVIIENSHIGPSFGKEAISHKHGHNWIVRNNHFIDSCANPQSESCTAIIGVFDFDCNDCYDVQADNFEIYGNVFASIEYHESHNDAVILAGSTRNWKFYNNNLVNLGYRVDGISLGEASEVYNTLWAPVGLYDDSNQYSAPVWCSAGTCENLWCQQHDLVARSYMSCNKLKETWPTTVVAGDDPFVDWQNMDFTLKDLAVFGSLTPIDAGKSLGSAYDNIDANGNMRGADGAWDIGAYEYTGTCTPMTISELSSIIEQWKDGSRTIEQVMQAIRSWKDGC